MADETGSSGEPRSIARLLQTKTAITTIVAIIAAAITLGKWGDNAWHWIRGDSQSSTPLHPVRLSVAAEHHAPTAAQFSVDGETDGVNGRFCTLRWTTYDAVNDEQLRGVGFTGRRRIRLDHHNCVVNETFSIPAPSNVSSLYAEVELLDASGRNRIAAPAKSKPLALAQP